MVHQLNNKTALLQQLATIKQTTINQRKVYWMEKRDSEKNAILSHY